MQTPSSEILTRVRGFLQENFLYMRPDLELGADDRLMERGIVDSMGVLEMLNFIETEFGVRASDDEISEANLGSLRAIAQFVAEKQTAAAA
jgi:acyl carrier protein